MPCSPLVASGPWFSCPGRDLSLGSMNLGEGSRDVNRASRSPVSQLGSVPVTKLLHAESPGQGLLGNHGHGHGFRSAQPSCLQASGPPMFPFLSADLVWPL